MASKLTRIVGVASATPGLGQVIHLDKFHGTTASYIRRLLAA